MAKTKKLVCILLVLVLCLTTLCGCALFTDSSTLYSKTAVKVGTENITLSTIANAYKNYVSNYYYYIYYYQTMTLSDAFNMAYNSVVNTYVLVNDYKAYADANKLTFNHEYANDYVNAKYLDKETMEYIIKYAKYVIYSAYDSSIVSLLKEEGYTIADDVSWAYRYDNAIKVIQSLADENSKISASSLQQMTDFYNTLNADSSLTAIDGYLFEDVNDPKLLDRVEKLNARLTLKEGQTPITAKKYISMQRKSIANVKATIQTNYYNQTTAQFFVAQVNEIVNNTIAGKKTALIAKDKIEGNTQILLNILKDRYDTLVAKAKEAYLFDETSFLSDVTGLSNGTNVYQVPEAYKDSFIYVKNLLIPFSQAQKDELAAKATELELDSTDKKEASEAYTQFRSILATKIVADNYLDGSKLSNLFKYDGASAKFELVEGTALLNQLQSVKSAEDFLQLMYKYNTDVAQFGRDSDYVAQVDDAEKKSTSWAKGFDTACEEAFKKGVGNYAVGITDYGVHIVYYVSKVEADVMNFTKENIYDTTTKEYDFFVAYYNKVAPVYASDVSNEIKKGMTNQITPTNALKRFMSNTNLKFAESK